MKPDFLRAVLLYHPSCTAIARSPVNLLGYTITGPPDAKLSAKQLQLSSPHLLDLSFHQFLSHVTCGPHSNHVSLLFF